MKTSPPVYIAISHSGLEYRSYTKGPLANIPTTSLEARLDLLRPYTRKLFEKAWNELPSSTKTKTLLCWNMCCDEESDNWTNRLRGHAVVIEMENVRNSYGCSGVREKDCSMSVELDLDRDDEDEFIQSFHGVFEMLEEWCDEHIDQTPLVGKPSSRTHEFLDLLDDFPVYLAHKRELFRKYPQAKNKLMRAFKDAWETLEPGERSMVRSAWGSYWTRKKWFEQDPDPKAFVVPDSTIVDVDECPKWDPINKAIVINDKFIMQSPEHEIMKSCTMAFKTILEFVGKPPRLLPLRIEKKIIAAGPAPWSSKTVSVF